MQTAKLILIIVLAFIGGAGAYYYVSTHGTAPMPNEVTDSTGLEPSAPADSHAGHTILDLSGKGLTRVPMDTFARTDLTALDLSNNSLAGALQAEVRHLSKLERLDLSHNAFTGLPAEVGQLSELTYLDLSHNKLTGLPYELGNLKKLEVLDLTGNDYAKADLAIIKQGLPNSVHIIGE